MTEGENLEIVKTDGAGTSGSQYLPISKEPTKPNLMNTRVLIPVGLGAVSVFGVINYLLSIAGLWTGWRLVTVAVIADAARGQVVAAAVALISGFIALITFTVNYHQKNYIQEKANFTAEQIADDNRKQQNKWEEDRLKIQQEHFDRQRKQEKAQADYDSIAAEYDALSKDFVSEKELSRINAAIGLAAVAMRPDPRRLFEEDITKPEDAPRTRDYYPWYERVASQLAAALFSYERSTELSQVRNSIKVIARVDTDGEQTLLYFLIQQVADANRAAYKRFLSVFAEGMASKDANILPNIARAISIYNLPSQNEQCLTEITRLPNYELALQAQTDMRVAEGYQTPGPPSSGFLSRLRTSAEQLVSTRDALANCLDSNVWKPKIELVASKRSDVTGNSTFFHFQSPTPTKNLDLQDTFLQAVHLGNSQLQYANLSRAQLQNAQLAFASLDAARIVITNFSGANLSGAKIRHAACWHSIFASAYLLQADLSNSSLDHSSFDAASLGGARLSGASINKTMFTNAVVSGMNVAGVQGLSDGSADFSGSNAWELDFRICEYEANFEQLGLSNEYKDTGDSDEVTREWFAKHYPEPTGNS